ncbi:NAD(P)-dependent glycerol-1-phosphate dehydrogenase [Halocatena pleomorpha]|uniref:Glycerol-1-phosphate dehydrogenase [NAD(P)+] n=1 Tax=Halocatena pleomorpha TaxID=1785090 RepID=A0A3P3RJG7_9EURY|nr:NAD(P)-dependent glycerol-1-phosphate dehydrogenase [Halocatena pleomorpha]RRJ32970.1 NAD(P)-dependent glycerol-1-phosphate dehydrogenase [Halocatena pleomorpha]
MFEKRSWIRLPRNVVIGHGVIEETGQMLSELHLSGTPLIVTSSTPKVIATDRVTEQLASDPPVELVETARFSSVEHVIERAQAESAGYLLGIGGGTVIDVAKMAADELGVGFVSVPTAASHDGIVSGRGSIPEGTTRHSVAADPPLGVIADTAIIAEAPWKYTTAGCADIISNYTAVRDWQLAARLKNAEYSEYAGALSRMTAEMLVGNADSINQGLEDSAWIVMKALVSSGVAMSIADSSRPASGAEHLISHQLDRIAEDTALHGHQVGVASITTEYLHSGQDGNWQNVHDALSNIGAPTTVAELGHSAEDFTEAMTTAHEIRDRYTILGNGVSEAAAREAARVTGVI